MSKEDSLFELKRKIEIELSEFFDDKIKQAKKQKKPEEFLKMIENSKRFVLSGGKRIRSILFYYGYLIAGGKKEKDILKASVSIELIHSYLLIHDDIIDRDDFRHNDLSMHYRYEEEYKKGLSHARFKNLTSKFQSQASEIQSSSFQRERSLDKNNSKHFGTSMAIIVGDLASSLGYEILIYSDFSANLKIKAVEKLNQIVLNTITGEAMDVILASCLNVDTNDVVKMQGYKTAKYTIEGPLHLGAILAGANKKFLESISDFAIPLGIAFQIQDDIIGVFGDEKKIGKPVGADIKEGKKTLLSIKALEMSNSKQFKKLSGSFGNRNASLDEINAVREIIKETGSLKYSLKKIEGLIRFSKARLEKIKISKEHKRSLLKLGEFIVKRKY